MKLSISGSRTYPLTKAEFDQLTKAKQVLARQRGKKIVSTWVIALLRPGDEVIAGAAKGPDTWAVEAARPIGHECHEIPADWSKGKGAGFDRNTVIAERGEALLAFWDGVSRGTRDTVEKAHRLHRPVLMIGPDGQVMWKNRAWMKLEKIDQRKFELTM